MEIIKHYRNNKPLRDSFNALAEATFGLNFENWYRNGFWGNNYDPYSVVLDGKVVANVSVNRTDMVMDGVRRKIYQLGTVMTDPEYRNRGLIRAIMAEVEKDIADADGVYLFANDEVVSFYPKFGFVPGNEYGYSRAVDQDGDCRMEAVPMDSPDNWERLSSAMAESRFETACRMVDNPGLIFFYVSQFMQENVYYCKDLNCWAVAELENGELTLHEVYAPAGVTLDAVIAAFGAGISRVNLCFAPADADGWNCGEYREEDCNFFVRGDIFDEFTEKRLRIPSLAHA